MAQGNIGWIFTRGYFKEEVLKQEGEFDIPYDFERTNEKILNRDRISTIEPIREVKDDEESRMVKIEMKTSYPGLLSGTGYIHEAKIQKEVTNPYSSQLLNTRSDLQDKKVKGSTDDYNDAFKIGFFFDHTTGMPVIPGSQVKGMLRSCFPQQGRLKQVKQDNKAAFEESIAERSEFLKDFIKSELQVELSKEDLDNLENEIFDGKTSDDKRLKIYDRDLFFDAVPVNIDPNTRIGQNWEKRLFGTDYITPHKNRDGRPELDPFSEPVPIKFLKVMPEVTYQFRFNLNDGAKLTRNKKLTLFKKLLEFTGIGAKTNVGYGHFMTNQENDGPSSADSQGVPRYTGKPPTSGEDVDVIYLGKKSKSNSYSKEDAFRVLTEKGKSQLVFQRYNGNEKEPHWFKAKLGAVSKKGIIQSLTVGRAVGSLENPENFT